MFIRFARNFRAINFIRRMKLAESGQMNTCLPNKYTNSTRVCSESMRIAKTETIPNKLGVAFSD